MTILNDFIRREYSNLEGKNLNELDQALFEFTREILEPNEGDDFELQFFDHLHTINPIINYLYFEEEKSVDVVKLLLDSGANINGRHRDNIGLDTIVANPIGILALDDGDDEENKKLMSLFLKAGTNPNGFSLIRHVIRQERLDLFEIIIKESQHPIEELNGLPSQIFTQAKSIFYNFSDEEIDNFKKIQLPSLDQAKKDNFRLMEQRRPTTPKVVNALTTNDDNNLNKLTDDLLEGIASLLAQKDKAVTLGVSKQTLSEIPSPSAKRPRVEREEKEDGRGL